jgi:LacI family transcriptional regulator
MVCQSNESYGREIVNTKRLMDSLVDGFIVSLSSESKMVAHLKKILDKKKPMVMFDRISSELIAPNVTVDNEGAGYMATQHLIEQGYKKIAILAGPKNLELSNNRMDGYLRALKENNIKVDKELIVYCDFNQDYAYFATKELLAMKKRPDAIFAIADKMAIGAMLAIKEKKLTMPNDIGLVGFNNDPATSLVTPTLSSIDMPAFELGKTAAKTFIEMMHSDTDMSQTHTVLKLKLIVRESSQRLPLPK